ncbi:unnamed protein product [Rhodiola kirilowii]
MDGPSCLYGNYANESDDSFGTEKATNPEILGLNKLSSSLEKLITDSNEYDYSDADIVVEGVEVGVHRCVLAVRNGYFHELFKNWDGEMGKGSRPWFKLNELVPDGVAVGYDAFRAVLRYIYTGKLEPCPAEVSTCVDDTCPHASCRPAIDYVVELMYASATFQINELVMVFQRRAMSFIDKAFIEDIIPITLLAFRCKMELLFTRCIQRLVQSGINNVFLEEELPPEVSRKIKMLRLKSKLDGQSNEVVTDTKNEEKIRKILKAMKGGDVALLMLLLEESTLTLDNVFALHYAAAYCEPEVMTRVLNTRMAGINVRDPQGYTVLQVAARRKEPSIVMALLTSGACTSATTHGREMLTAVTICRRCTRSKDYNEDVTQGKETSKSKLCIDLLERGRCKSPITGYPNLATQIADDLQREVDDLEQRVLIAQKLFPQEANLAIGNAMHAFPDIEFARPSASRGLFERLDMLHLDESSEMKTRRLMAKLVGLQKTVETGRCYFPHCSEVIDKFLSVDLDILYLETGTQEEQHRRKRSYEKIKEDVKKAFDKDMMADNNYNNSRSSLSSSSSASTSSLKVGGSSRARKS